ncbi:gamma-glutamyltranspeptidase / glutathione hydrolase [Goodfellowiella coeruleoviolacea]|uniref:Gamma-glutamyltranspeptidase / glutathione hydrolase n=2 Tax=Goodfellowiella coeruleoviolacea TaxID=334858 RepID=A0AAE3G9R0_9PSEU|nr:gamma-glutamyltranspeptidase / glutathione hydrolase [Goodfellowiella coeruleoviolacea]
MVAAANPAAVLAGCQVLLAGGSAVDAAVAVQAVLAVVEPQSSGLGGGSLLTHYDAATRTTRVYDGLAESGRRVTAGLGVPTAWEQRRYGVAEFDSGVDHSARAVGVPGTLAALELAHREHGSRPWRSLFDTAITLADAGFPVAPYLHDVLANASTVTPSCAYPDLRALFCDGDQPKPVGARVRNPELAGVLREVRDGGAAAFYSPTGDIAPAIVRRLHAGAFDATADEHGPAVIPSLLTVADFAAYRAVRRDPVCTAVLAHTLCTAPPPATGGLTLTALLAMAQARGVTGFAPDSAEYAHLVVEASRLAGVDSRAHVGDPDVEPVPVAGLTDPGYLAARAALISPDSANHPVLPGHPDGAPARVAVDAAGGGDTTSQISVVDARGDALAMTTTVNLNFGSRVLARGIVLNNVATNFSAEGAEVNAMAPTKRPRTSIAPTIVFDRAGQPRLVVGAAGGGPIPDYVAQTVLGVLGYGRSPLAAISAPHVSGQTRVADCGGSADVASDVEAGTGLTQPLLAALTARNHPCARAVPLRSGLAAVEVTGQTLLGAADPRRDGTALGG